MYVYVGMSPCVSMGLTLRMYHHIVSMFVCDTRDHTHGGAYGALSASMGQQGKAAARGVRRSRQTRSAAK